MKKIFCFLLFGAICLNLSAQDIKAKTILDKVSAKNKEFKSISAEFTFSMDNAEEDIHEVSEGNIVLVGNKYRLKLMGVDTYYDGTTMFSHIIDVNEVNITKPEENEEEGLNPAQIFSIYEKGYNYKYIREETVNSSTYHVIDLIPLNSEREFSSIQLRIDKAKNQIESLKTIGKDGNNVSITLKKLTPNLKFADSYFVFDPKSNPDVEVNDMR
ncbi:outer membrane lipoprotein carrier protein LolA [Labilibaculum sp. A4]|uniref:LolA family protein n=1 Tax=Labilibaculum euxinus TaxID=2686357 RepID=UPI000F6240AC|nr:outer membrane lipoprotein carrier protein LolA [Labilibaculum euxinus]MDQ1771839.1 outer membrane lipoprotein carrier protein LolA [Labilibaculum euxinus]MWN77742.1 outer membrane lipoprotein carrier protein LolA [Labilibaculum euxinus]